MAWTDPPDCVLTPKDSFLDEGPNPLAHHRRGEWWSIWSQIVTAV
jgi:hypothetical protein